MSDQPALVAKSADAGEHSVVGTRPVRADVADKTTGRALFGPDISLPGLLHARFLRSPHAHARIRSIDTRRAKELPGVHAIVTAEDLPSVAELTATLGEVSTNLRYRRDNTLACAKVLYEGHAVAAVAATSPHIAQEAVDLIAVDYELLPWVVDVHEARAPDAPLLHDALRTESLAGKSESPSNVASHSQWVLGDLEQGFGQADVVVEREFTTATIHQGYIEPHAATAVWDAGGQLTLWSTTQGAFSVRDQVASLLNRPLSTIRVVPTEVGGGFGGKNDSYVDAVAALLSLKTGLPVRAVMTRREVFVGSGPTSGSWIRVKMGATRDGRICAAQAELCYEAGAYPGSPVGSGGNTIFGPYDVPNAQIDCYDVVVNRPKISSYRAPGATQASFAGESVVDELAERLGIDALEFRRINAAVEGSERVMGGVCAKIGSLEVLETAKKSAHCGAPLVGPNRGRGVAVGIWGTWGAQSSASLSVNTDGTLNLITGSVDLSGTRTSVAMQAAEVLGLPIDRFRSTVGDTDSIGFTEVSGGSRTTYATGMAAIEAANDVIAKMRHRATLVWDVPLESVIFEAGTFRELGGVQVMSFGELAVLLPSTGGPLVGHGHLDAKSSSGGYTAHIADVEVDPETGKVTLLRYTAVQDVGKAIHPGFVEGQMQGGAVMGIGWALWEGYRYDSNGHMLNPTFLDYKMPTALDVPPIETLIVEVPNPDHPFGVRGVGEPPVIPPPAALANAIHRATGARMETLPMTPTAILERMGVI